MGPYKTKLPRGRSSLKSEARRLKKTLSPPIHRHFAVRRTGAPRNQIEDLGLKAERKPATAKRGLTRTSVIWRVAAPQSPCHPTSPKAADGHARCDNQQTLGG